MRTFVLALVALTAIVGVGLNILLGLTGQVSLGHVGFYAIGAYTVAILTVKGVSFWLAFPLAGADRRRRSARCWRCRRCASPGPISRWSPSRSPSSSSTARSNGATLTGGAERPDGPRAAGARRACVRASARWRCLAILLAGVSLYLFHRLAGSAWGKAMVAVRDSETAARSIGLNPVIDQDRRLRAVGGVRRPCRRASSRR